MVAVPPLLLLPSPLEEEEDVIVGLALASVFAGSPPDPPAGLSVGVPPLLPLAGCGAGGCCCGIAETVEKRKKMVRTRRDRA